MYPKVRFRGFDASQEFKNCLLSEVARNLDNKRIPITANKRKKGKIPYFGSNGIQDYVKGYTHNGTFILIAEDGANNLKHYPVIKATGKIWVNNHAHVLQALDKKIDFNYLYFLLFKYNFEKYLVGSGRYKLNAAVLEKLPIKICNSKNEQIAIGKILASIDNLLSLQQRKLELESLLYKHLKRNCFYNNYNFYYSKPKKLNIKMKDIITLEDNQRIPVSENNRKKGITPYYGANGIQDYVDGYTHVGQYILIAEDGASDIQNYPVIAVNGKVWINNHAHVLKVNKTVDFSYLLYFLKNFNYFPWLVGSGRFKLNAKTLLNIKISIDSNTENQRKIGVLLNECDSLTHATSTRIKLIKDIKQFLLQNLFI
ncbi:restriction endonuclease subunit S [Lactobacillus mulieris]|uniref:restriction endonuclease subunit S n=1 Tax=Lactobacillus mulieris TaxID=2508708 RepID=UPI0022AC58EE|nr:restriction endonuclease subunit S [Lactobacillus mulieris]MCZ3623075.1 restriction endonuclease subunit S [Lactobacillus mulieris]MCZ3710743.1 restriction endonuclease subunit S [Lactobacillus mulieris]MCZ3722838.1 restriction endonuclease subunit S [Lactobacillus mulieris]MCZ3744339.1 restriction endonuclease subunit S [Lactobacillus mulieris]